MVIFYMIYLVYIFLLKSQLYVYIYDSIFAIDVSSVKFYHTWPLKIIEIISAYG